MIAVRSWLIYNLYLQPCNTSHTHI